jgi:hypothetical protein
MTTVIQHNVFNQQVFVFIMRLHTLFREKSLSRDPGNLLQSFTGCYPLIQKSRQMLVVFITFIIQTSTYG